MSSSTVTKSALAEALKKLCREKPLEKISISDITNECGLNRQSFYYHFQDKYELLGWIYFNELFVHFNSGVGFHNWEESLEEFLTVMKQEEEFYCSTLSGSDHTFENQLYKIMHRLFVRFIHHAVKKMATRSKADFFANYYAHGFCGVIIDWAKKGMKDSPELLVSKIKELAFENVLIGEGFRENL